jgi:hypothetical protein
MNLKRRCAIVAKAARASGTPSLIKIKRDFQRAAIIVQIYI